MIALLMAQLGFGLYGLINYDQLIEKGLLETIRVSKGNEELLKAWEGLQNEVKTG